jgi:Transglycosylase SLT domain
MQALDKARRALAATADSAGVVARDIGHGLLEIGHNSLAALGLLVVGAVIFVGGNRDLLASAESQAREWLQSRHEAREESHGNLLVGVSEPAAVERATATDPASLSRQQAAVTHWIARRYKVAPEPIARLVQEAWLEPTLILAIMAVESSFNPFAQSPVGAQGLMQVMTRIHDDKYEAFGGTRAAFDPVSNLRVGVQVLKECIARAGSLEAGLRFYVGAANLPDDGGYAGRVLGEQNLLRRVLEGKAVAPGAPVPVQTSAPAAPQTPNAQPSLIPATQPADRGVDAVADDTERVAFLKR